VLYYVRRNFFPSKEVDYEQIKVRTLTSKPEELAPPTPVAAPTPALGQSQKSIIHYPVPKVAGDSAPPMGYEVVQAQTVEGAFNLESLDDDEAGGGTGGANNVYEVIQD
jgi:hypothetical protein